MRLNIWFQISRNYRVQSGKFQHA